ncbi:hypothetical protein LP419_11290 [Massilia sp. H-1]|nr:hypothetical protein LP419_11290 [Massilia sp. H-1]
MPLRQRQEVQGLPRQAGVSGPTTKKRNFGSVFFALTFNNLPFLMACPAPAGPCAHAHHQPPPSRSRCLPAARQ